MAVRAKMRVTGLSESAAIAPGTDEANPYGRMVTVTLQPVYGGKEDGKNAEWSKWTPSGEVKLTITNPAAFEQFKIGKPYFVDFTPADE